MSQRIIYFFEFFFVSFFIIFPFPFFFFLNFDIDWEISLINTKNETRRVEKLKVDKR